MAGGRVHAVGLLLNHGHCPQHPNCFLEGCRWGRGQDTVIYYRGENKPGCGFLRNPSRLPQTDSEAHFEQQCRRPLVCVPVLGCERGESEVLSVKHLQPGREKSYQPCTARCHEEVTPAPSYRPGTWRVVDVSVCDEFGEESQCHQFITFSIHVCPCEAAPKILHHAASSHLKGLNSLWPLGGFGVPPGATLGDCGFLPLS